MAGPFLYLLGLYLGDGHLATYPRTYQLRITLDSKYPSIIQEAAAAVRVVVPGHRVALVAHPHHNLVRVQSYWAEWARVFPQHGKGPKHSRRIYLPRWQAALAAESPRPLVRGLLHSDGCRCIATIRGRGREYRYPRYYFSNRSEDIKAIFCHNLDLLGVAWTKPGPSQIQIARRDAVADLDEFVGPKS